MYVMHVRRRPAVAAAAPDMSSGTLARSTGIAGMLAVCMMCVCVCVCVCCLCVRERVMWLCRATFDRYSIGVSGMLPGTDARLVIISHDYPSRLVCR